MRTHLLLCDIGNTTIKIGLTGARQDLAAYSLPAHGGETADSLGLTLLSLLDHAGVGADSLMAVVVSSVVPGIDPVLKEAAARYLDCQCLFVPNDLPVPLENRYERPDEVGADRLVAAYAARNMLPEPKSLIVVDYGTAVTFDCVNGQAYIGGLIFPGPQTAVAALAANTAKLPTVNLDIRAQDPTPGRDTATSIRHGLVFGFVCVTDGLVKLLRKELPGPTKVVATGGFSQAIARISPVFDAVVPSLVLDGLRRLYQEQKGA